MKSSPIGIAVILVVLAVSTTVLASEYKTTYPNLVGTWTGESLVMFVKDERLTKRELRITEQKGSLFRGTVWWAHVDQKEKPLFVTGGKRVNKATVSIVGVIGFDGKTINMAVQGENAFWQARLVDSDTIEALFTASGSGAAAFRDKLKRKR